MEYSDYLAAQKFIERNANALYDHEKKDFAQVGYPIANYTEYKKGQRVFYSVSTNVFKHILKTDLVNAQLQFPLNFGNGNAICVIHALEKVMGLYGGTKKARRFLQSENCCWVLENQKAEISERILRIDLFRKLDKVKHKRRKYDFTGGLLHAFKHFSYQGKPLSTGKENNDYQPAGIIGLIIDAFFIQPGTFTDDQTYISEVQLNSKSILRFVFYRKLNTNIFFIKTLFKMRL